MKKMLLALSVAILLVSTMAVPVLADNTLFLPTVSSSGDDSMVRAASLVRSAHNQASELRKVNGLTYGEWSALWWTWVESERRNGHDPLNEEGDIDCHSGQSGKVWFFGGTEGGAAERTCTEYIRPGTEMLFPLINIVYTVEPGEAPVTVEEKRETVSWFLDLACNLQATIDGREINSNRFVRTQSPPFSYTLYPNSVPLEQRDPEAIGGGYWLRLSVPAGEHTVKFAGAYCDSETGDPFFGVDVTYHLTVKNVMTD